MKGYVPQLVAMGVVVGALLRTYQPAFPGTTARTLSSHRADRLHVSVRRICIPIPS